MRLLKPILPLFGWNRQHRHTIWSRSRPVTGQSPFRA